MELSFSELKQTKILISGPHEKLRFFNFLFAHIQRDYIKDQPSNN